jgi:hypothetical protein
MTPQPIFSPGAPRSLPAVALPGSSLSPEQELLVCRRAIEKLTDAPGGHEIALRARRQIDAAETFARKIELADAAINEAARWRTRTDKRGADDINDEALDLCDDPAARHNPALLRESLLLSVALRNAKWPKLPRYMTMDTLSLFEGAGA